MSDIDLDAIEARAKAATHWTPADCGEASECATLGDTLIQLAGDYEGVRDDWEFLSHAREDVPALVAEVRALRARDAENDIWMREATKAVAGIPAGAFTGHPVVDSVAGLRAQIDSARADVARLTKRLDVCEQVMPLGSSVLLDRLDAHEATIARLRGLLGEAREFVDEVRVGYEASGVRKWHGEVVDLLARIEAEGV